MCVCYSLCNYIFLLMWKLIITRCNKHYFWIVCFLFRQKPFVYAYTFVLYIYARLFKTNTFNEIIRCYIWLIKSLPPSRVTMRGPIVDALSLSHPPAHTSIVLLLFNLSIKSKHLNVYILHITRSIVKKTLLSFAFLIVKMGWHSGNIFRAPGGICAYRI